jgi:cold shock CspA family protein
VLGLPQGRKVAVVRTPHQDERYADLGFALRDTFKHARRRLQDQARRLRGQTKFHEGRRIGTVTRLDADGGFGFLESSDGRQLYFHRNSVLGERFAELVPGSYVTFAEEAGEKGPQASAVKLLGRLAMRM